MKQQFFVRNRQKLQGITVLSAYQQMQRGNDASFMFEQESNFWYVTGITAPNWRVIIDGENSAAWLVAPDVDSVHQIFDGSLSWDEARKVSGIENIVTQKQADELLEGLAKKYPSVYTLGKDRHSAHYDFYQNPAQKTLRHYLKKYFTEIKDCRLDLAKLRAIKQPEEIQAIRNAIKVTNNTFEEVKKILPTLRHEYEVEAEFSYRFRKQDAAFHAYDPIVASGKNACTLHYNQNNDTLQKNSLLLIDIGARVDGYAADITRTYAVGQPTDRQIAVHAAVESAQQRIISLLKPGLLVKEYHEKVDDIMQTALKNLGLGRATPDGSRGYFPHAISHGLGIDVHDSLGRPDEFLPGMVLTVEPGIYIPEEGIGVRIEDDILITESGHENLSTGLSTSL